MRSTKKRETDYHISTRSFTRLNQKISFFTQIFFSFFCAGSNKTNNPESLISRKSLIKFRFWSPIFFLLLLWCYQKIICRKKVGRNLIIICGCWRYGKLKVCVNWSASFWLFLRFSLSLNTIVDISEKTFLAENCSNQYKFLSIDCV